jgi:hypothetical protein
MSMGRRHVRSELSDYETVEGGPDDSGDHAGVSAPLRPPGPIRSAAAELPADDS